LDFTLEERSKRYLLNHTTLPEKFNDGASVLKPPLRNEGFSKTYVVQTTEQLEDALQKINES